MADAETATKPVEAVEDKAQATEAGAEIAEEQPSVAKPVDEESVKGGSVQEEPAQDKAVAEEPAQDKAVAEEPAQGKAVAEEPAQDKAVAEESTQDEPSKDDKADKSNAKSMMKTRAEIDKDNFRNNVKFDPSTRKVTDEPEAIRKQVEFYFGDWNFPQDKFMWESCGGTANKAMPIAKIHSFKRMRVFQPYSAVVAALRESSFLVVSGEEGQELVKRKVAYRPMAETRVKLDASTAYVKGFGDETPETQFDLESFFAKFGEVKGLKLRRTPEGLFKGSVFVTFPSEEAAQAFVALDPAPTYKGHELKIMSKRAYCDEKSDLIRQGKLEPSSTSSKKFFEGREAKKGAQGNKDGRSGDGDGHMGDWKKRRENDQKNGFRDGRGGGGGRGSGRGGRGRGGRGRGGRGRGGFGRGGRDNGGRDGDAGRDKAAVGNRHDGMPRIQSTADEAPSKGKRAREDDGGEGAPAAKKVDKKEPAAEAS